MPLRAGSSPKGHKESDMTKQACTHAQLLQCLDTQMVKHLPAMQETWVRFLSEENPLEKEMAIHSSTLAWITPWTEELDRL